ncbi:hypothetical protein SAMN05444487_105112 [Marininema mesophilum]|uniref:Uncharacterized protein n=1 Tax=Marininema mesophilum TaxID=1048340 RepID=A0A1H2VHR6_9BACL|nr:hypothetical protein [Marininema mesophilum]SDW67862.1 hypothetical protein SAMN05444487_105112 [Marininema mesophilum]
MSDSELTKKHFADWINQTVGSNVANEKIMEQLLLDAKESYSRQGLDGFFEYIRQLTQAPLSNTQLKQMMDTVVGAGSATEAFRQLSDHAQMPAESVQLVEEGKQAVSPNRRERRKGRKGTRG